MAFFCYNKEMKKNLIVAYKEIGISPLDLINKIRDSYPELRNEKMAYAGRLDPLAEGIVLIVVGKELEKFDSYLNLDKEYEAKILLGFSSDTYDILGISEREDSTKEEEAPQILEKFTGKFSFSLPPFSSYKIKGKPLFWWALEGKLNDIEIPKKEVDIYSVEIIKAEWVDEKSLKKEIVKKIEMIKGDFRQKEIIERWENILKKEEKKHLIVRVKISCSSGSYIRSVADALGKKLEGGGVLFSLYRKRVGQYGEKLDL